MPQKDKKPDLTPEERLFRLIQEDEKSEEKEDTLISSGSAVSAGEAEPEKKAAEIGSLPSAKETREKIAARAAGGRNAASVRPPSSLFNVFGPLLSLQVLNRLLAGCLFALLFYFVISHGLVRESPNADFMLKANASSPSPVEVPSNLFAVNVSQDAVPERNVFQPYRPPEPKAPEATQPEVVSNFQVLQQLKLSGIYMDAEPEALVESKDEKKTYVLKSGSLLKGLTVKSVKEDGVIFTDGQSEQTLK